MNPGREDEITEDNWKMHHQIKTESFKALDSIVLLAGSGSFGLSLAFLSLVKNGFVQIDLLLCSWAFLIASLVALGISHFANGFGSMWVQNRIGYHRAKGSPATFLIEIDQSDERKRYDNWAWYSRLSAIVALVLGLIFMFIFAACNLSVRSINGHYWDRPYRQNL